MKFIALQTKGGELKGDIAFFCRILHVSRQGFYQYLANKDRPWKYQPLADAMKEILTEDECNDTYGRIRMYQALTLKQPENVDIPSERTVYRIMEEIGISHHPRRKPNGITKADREARKSDDLLKRDFHAEEPLSKCVTDITEIAKGAEAGGADAVSLINTLTGMKIDINRKTFALANKTGGVSGPIVKPIAVRMVYQVAQAVNIPIIGMGGISCAEDAIEFILAGASAVSVGTANFHNPAVTLEVIDGIEAYMKKNGFNSVKEMVGIVK